MTCVSIKNVVNHVKYGLFFFSVILPNARTPTWIRCLKWIILISLRKCNATNGYYKTPDFTSPFRENIDPFYIIVGGKRK